MILKAGVESIRNQSWQSAVLAHDSVSVKMNTMWMSAVASACQQTCLLVVLCVVLY